jgi:hypothetical protein
MLRAASVDCGAVSSLSPVSKSPYYDFTNAGIINDFDNVKRRQPNISLPDSSETYAENGNTQGLWLPVTCRKRLTFILLITNAV